MGCNSAFKGLTPIVLYGKKWKGEQASVFHYMEIASLVIIRNGPIMTMFHNC